MTLTQMQLWLLQKQCMAIVQTVKETKKPTIGEVTLARHCQDILELIVKVDG